MTIHHHPSDETLFAHAGGGLARSLALAVAAHVEACEQCCRVTVLAEASAGVLLETLPSTTMSLGALARTLQRLDVPVAGISGAAKASDWALPRSLRDERAGMRRWLAPGLWLRPIRKDRAEGTRLYLIGAAAGKALPRHGHSGVEMTQVLKGEFFDADTRFGPGDFLEAADAHEHRPLVGPGGECVCLIASQGVPKGLPGLLMRVFT